MWQNITSGREWRGELLNRKKDGSLFWEAVSISPITNDAGSITHFVAVNEDISLRKSYENDLLHQANYDSLTGLANRLLVKDRLAQAISRAQRTGTMVAVLFIDLDDFKKVNDSLGHSAGDELLIETGRRLEHCVRATDTVGRDNTPEGDTVARLGGDEFVVILSDVQYPASVERVAWDILQSVSESFTVAGHEVFVTNSIGITLYPDDGRDIEDLMRNADLAMYQAKESGRGVFRFFTNEFNDMAVERLKLEAELRHAIEKDELALYYQPIISNADDTIAGAEALLRWNNKALGPSPPDRFIPISESTGLIVEIGHWVLERGFRDFAELSSRAENTDFYLSLNVSSRQLREPSFADEFCMLARRYDIAIDRIKAEITESLILEDTQHTQSNLAMLAGVGVRFSVDDFGTGYSSLKYLKKLPVDTLKIDRSFISDACTNPDDASLVRSIAAMARGLGIQVIAEGVETAEQKRFATEVGCHYTQGYFTGRPVPLHDFYAPPLGAPSAVEI
jgi:diguanylate cyclase (GGDEF)-like protein